jgi:O-antigen/teichoic acid export membrane protein
LVEPAAAPTGRSWGARLGKHTLYYGVGILVEKGVAFAMLPFYTRYLTPADYGVMALVALTLEVVMIVAGARLATGVHRYYHKAETEEQRRGVVATALLLLAVSFFALGAVCWLLAADLSALVIGTRQYDDLFRLAAASLGFQGLLIVPLAYFRVRGQSGRYTAATLSKLAMQASMNVALLVAGLGVKAMFVCS